MFLIAAILEAVAVGLLIASIVLVGFHGPPWITFGSLACALLGAAFAFGATLDN